MLLLRMAGFFYILGTFAIFLVSPMVIGVGEGVPSGLSAIGGIISYIVGTCTLVGFAAAFADAMRSQTCRISQLDTISASIQLVNDKLDSYKAEFSVLFLKEYRAFEEGLNQTASTTATLVATAQRPNSYHDVVLKYEKEINSRLQEIKSLGQEKLELEQRCITAQTLPLGYSFFFPKSLIFSRGVTGGRIHV